MGTRRCTLCGEEKASGEGETTFVCDACLGLPARDLLVVMRGLVSAEDVPAFLSQQHRVPTIDLGEYEIAEEVRKLLTREECERHVIVPVSRIGHALVVAMTDPTDTDALDAVAEATRTSVEPVIASAAAIRSAIARYWP